MYKASNSSRGKPPMQKAMTSTGISTNANANSGNRSTSRHGLKKVEEKSHKDDKKTTVIKKQSISSKQKLIPKPPINSSKQPLRSSSRGNTQLQILPRIPIKTFSRKRQNIGKDCKWTTIPCSFLITICQYACKTPLEVYKFSRVCSFWRALMCSEQGLFFWNEMKGLEQIETFYDFKIFLQKRSQAQQEKMSFQFQKYFTKLFNYGSTKENIPNKLITKLDLELEVRLNNRPSVLQPFKLRTFNFSSYLCCKIQQIKDFKYDFYTPHNMFKDNINIQMIFRSKKFKVVHKINKKYCPEQVVESAIKQKAYNYYLDKNFVFTYFEGDNHFIYIFYEISVLELVNIFRGIIKNQHQESLQKKVKKLPMYKQLCQTQFEDFVQYVKFQADFQIHFSYHNSLKQIFTHCDTKVFPIDYDKKHAYFEIKVEDSFPNCATYKLDNKMGMSESVEGLFLLDFVLKDRDRFLIIFSGFIYAREATQKERESIDNYFQFADHRIKILESKQEKYFIQFLIIEEGGRNMMKNVRLTFFA